MNQDLEVLTNKVIGVAIDVHKQLGPGFAEKVYQRALYIELKRNHLVIEREYKIQLTWNHINIGYQVVDFLIEGELILELKATGETQDIHKWQLLSYLKAGNKRLGLLLNFGSKLLGIKRVINSYNHDLHLHHPQQRIRSAKNQQENSRAEICELCQLVSNYLHVSMGRQD